MRHRALIACAVFIPGCALTAAFAAFGPPATFTVGAAPGQVAVADFNEDGHLDLAVISADVNSLGPGVAVLTGDGAGQFALPYLVAVDMPAEALATGDLNVDGHADLLAGRRVLLGDGEGGFTPSVLVPFAPYYGTPRSTAIADLNGDRVPDVVQTSTGMYGSEFALFLADGAGGFWLEDAWEVGSAWVGGIVTGDLNGDGRPDVAAAAGANLFIYHRNWPEGAENGFSYPSPYFAGTGGDFYLDVALGDFNGDGAMDLAAPSTYAYSVRLALGNGMGDLAQWSDWPSGGAEPVTIAAADFDGDGALDVVTANRYSDNLSLLYGTGSGSFGSPMHLGTGPFPTDVAISDFNEDGWPDIVASNSWGGTVTVYTSLVNTPAGTEISVAPVDSSGGGSPLDVTFETVTSSGYTSLTTSATGPALPEGFQLGDPPTYYDIETSAGFTDLVTVCIHYAGVSYQDEDTLRLLHGLPGETWEDITTSLDTVHDVICGLTSSFSPFVVAEAPIQDHTPPVVSISSPVDGATYLLNQSVAASYTCEDTESGVASCLGSVPPGGWLDTAAVGPRTFTVTATDAAGNVSSPTVAYQVRYDFTGFLQPVDNLPVVNVVNGGRTVPIKWRLADAAGTPVTSVASFVSLWSGETPCDISPADTIPDNATSLSSESLHYDVAGEQFVYNWKTEKSWAGTCRQVWLTLADGTVRAIGFRFQ